MSETKKQRMDPDRFIEIFERYSFEEKADILRKLKGLLVKHGETLRDKLEADLREIENKIS